MPIENIKTINKLVSKEITHISEDIIEKVNKFYWTEIRRQVHSGEVLNIRIRGFGTITSSKRKVSKAISKTIEHIRYMKFSKDRYKKNSSQDILNNYYSELKALLKRRNELATIFYNRDQIIKERIKSKNEKVN